MYPMPTVMLCTTAQIRKQPWIDECPWIDEWIKHVTHTHTHTHTHTGMLLIHKKLKSCFLQQHGWTWRVGTMLIEMSQTKTNTM